MGIPGVVAAVFPAHAGMNRDITLPNDGHYGVPRTRGDEPQQLQKRNLERKCSPHTRK